VLRLCLQPTQGGWTDGQVRIRGHSVSANHSSGCVCEPQQRLDGPPQGPVIPTVVGAARPARHLDVRGLLDRWHILDSDGVLSFGGR